MKNRFFYLILVLILISCNEENKQLSPIPEQNIQAVLWQQQSGEFKALCYQAFELAKIRLEQITDTLSSSKPPAIIADVDETLLDNSPYNAYLIKNNLNYTPETWEYWVNLEKAEPIPGAVDFLKFADANGINIFYVSNRSEKDVEKTIRNFEKYDFPQLSYDRFFFKTTTSNKEKRRQTINENYNVVLLLGDNLDDFAEVFENQSPKNRKFLADSLKSKFGNNYIVFPNPIYGSWESAIYNYDFSKTDSARNIERNNNINAF